MRSAHLERTSYLKNRRFLGIRLGALIPFWSRILRMGSFNSSASPSPKTLPDHLDQDADLALPEGSTIARHELLRHLRHHLRGRVHDQHLDAHPMIRRKFLQSSGRSNDKNADSIRILQWNVLSQALGVVNDNFARCPEEALHWPYRRYRIVEEIVHYAPDIACLQEVDRFAFLRGALATQGYAALFFPKPDSPCLYVEGNSGPDGCAIFYRPDRFEVVDVRTRVLEVWRVRSNQVGLMVILRERSTGREVCVATTHLKARRGALLAALRNEQGKDLLRFVSSSSDRQRPIILCGDFNAEPSEPVYSTVLAGHEDVEFESAYAKCCGDLEREDNNSWSEPPYTTWKIREEGECCHTIDYVFYTRDRGVELDGVYDLPTGEDIGVDRVPSFSYPSDHFSLVCDFRLN